MELETVVNVQQTAFLLMAFCVFLVCLDGREAHYVPFWYVASVIIPMGISAAVFMISTIIRIWM